MAKFIVTVEQVITTNIEVEASSAAEARRKIESYGAGEAALDMANDDTKTARIKSVAKRQSPISIR